MSSIQPHETRPARPRSLVRRLWREASAVSAAHLAEVAAITAPERPEFSLQAGSVEQIGLDFLARLVASRGGIPPHCGNRNALRPHDNTSCAQQGAAPEDHHC